MPKRYGVEQTNDNGYRGERAEPPIRRVYFSPTCASGVTVATLVGAWEVGSANSIVQVRGRGKEEEEEGDSDRSRLTTGSHTHD